MNYLTAKVISFLFLFVAFCNAEAQDYTPFPEDSALWVVPLSNPSSDQPQLLIPHLYMLNGEDTIIQGQCYNKLYGGGGYPQGDGSFWPYPHPFTYIAAYRNDVPNKKVYLVSAHTKEELLLYDFDLRVGDTVKAEIGKGLVITKIDTVITGLGKRYYTNLVDPFLGIAATRCTTSCDTACLIEGVGNSYGLIEIMARAFQIVSELEECTSVSIPNKISCDPLGLEEAGQQGTKMLERIYTSMGQIIPYHEIREGNLYIFQYQDGTTRKIIRER